MCSILMQVIGADSSKKVEYNYAASLHQAFKWFNHCNKNSVCIPNAQVLLVKAYKSYKLSIDKVGWVVYMRPHTYLAGLNYLAALTNFV